MAPTHWSAAEDTNHPPAESPVVGRCWREDLYPRACRRRVHPRRTVDRPRGDFLNSSRALHRLTQSPEPEAKFEAHYIAAAWNKATARTINRHVCNPVILCECKALRELSEGPMLRKFVFTFCPVPLGFDFGRLLWRAEWRQQCGTESQETSSSAVGKRPRSALKARRHQTARGPRIERLTKCEAANIITYQKLRYGTHSV